MKKALTIILITLFINNYLCATENKEFEIKKSINDTLISQLQAINFNQFQGQPVDSILSILPQGYINIKVGTWKSLKRGDVLYVLYPNNIFVAIHVKNFQHMNPNLQDTSNPSGHWNVNLFRQELVWFSIVFNHQQCINGCEYKNK